jgi:phosphohistidine phosphatase
MKLYLLRHGIAAERGPRWAGHDADRPLTKTGSKKVLRVGEAMKEMELSFDLILSSPFRRARETAEIVADLFDYGDRLKYSAHLKVGGRPASLIREIKTHYPSCRSILLVGHEPYLSSLISVLMSGEDRLLITMKKGGLCKLEAQSLRYGRCASLQWLLGPSQVLHTK